MLVLYVCRDFQFLDETTERYRYGANDNNVSCFFPPSADRRLVVLVVLIYSSLLVVYQKRRVCLPHQKLSEGLVTTDAES
mmetsp:Transcript_24174/g.66976  ORF Transcript_24174/g.66976 Transcript_24174/m.66976 type:complete len:80 (+) Transcript_24174:1980-2219(+)